MTDLPVLVAGQARDLLLDGTRYTIAALTYAEHAAQQLARAAQQRLVVASNQTLRTAIRIT